MLCLAGWAGVVQGVDPAGGRLHHLQPQLVAVGLGLRVLPAGPVVRAAETCVALPHFVSAFTATGPVARAAWHVERVAEAFRCIV